VTTRIPIRLEPQRKYKNRRTRGFASAKEAHRFQELQLLEKAGEIRNLRAEKKSLRWSLVVKGVKITTYEADFSYTLVSSGEFVVEDVKDSGRECS
jgi:hypothetical protein